MKKNIKILAVVSTVIIVGSATAYILSDNNSIGKIPIHEPGSPSYDYEEGSTIAPGEYFDPIFNDITGDYRPAYDFFSPTQYDWFFSKLPPFPEDFFYIAQLVYQGKITDYDRLDENYWKQPEFYPGWFKSVVNSSYVKPEEWVGMWTPEGYGCYPTIKEITLKNSRGKSVVINTYFRTAFDTNSYQGLIIRPYFPDKAVGILGGTLFEQPDNVERYISLNILNEDDKMYNSFKNMLASDNVGENDYFTILKPTHKIIRDKYGNKIGETGFPDDWVRILQIELNIAEDTPAGQYVVAIKIDKPCDAINQEFYYSKEHDYYGLDYFPGGDYQLTGRPHFQAIINLHS